MVNRKKFQIAVLETEKVWFEYNNPCRSNINDYWILQSISQRSWGSAGLEGVEKIKGINNNVVTINITLLQN